MRCQKIKILTIFISFFILSSTLLSAASGLDDQSNEIPSEERQLVLAKIDDPTEMEMLKEMDLDVIDKYGDHVLFKGGKMEVKALRLKDIKVNELNSRTKVSVKGRTFDITEGEPEFSSDLTIESYEESEEGLYLVHLLGPINPEWRETLEQKGVEIINYVPNYAYEVKMTPKEAERVRDLFFTDWAGIFQPEYKLESGLEPGKVNVKMMPGLDPKEVKDIRAELPALDPEGLSTTPDDLILNVTSKDELKKLARMREVYHISGYEEPELHSEVDAQTIGGGAVIMDDEDEDPKTPYRRHGDFGAYINQLGYSGEGVVIASGDTGLGNGTVGDAGHPDLTGRVIGGHGFEYLDEDQWSDNHGHGTHTMGSAAGDTYHGSGEKGEYPGFGPYHMGQGLAYDSKLYSAKIFNPGWVGADYYDIIEVPKQEADAYIHTNSWGASTQGDYTESDEIFDQSVRDADRNTSGNQPMVITMSAGNSGSQEKTTGSPGNAKNVITIGATKSFMPDGKNYGGGNSNNPEKMAWFSSRGWTNDSRIKPDVVAPGENVLSTGNPMYSKGATYEWMSGTSMSNPTVAGAAAVTTEWYEENHGERPSPAMVKSLLINTAYDLDNKNCNTEPIPNKDEGWGMVDISKLEYPKNDPIPFMLKDQKSLLQTGDVDEYEVEREREGKPLKISLVWTDKNAKSGDNPALKNDLNLEVESPSGDIYRGNAFSDGWTRANRDTMADFDSNADGWDDTNNVENIYIDSDEVEEGTYTVRVEGFNVPADANNDSEANQDYALSVYNAVSPSCEITSPRENAVVRRSNVTLEWTSERAKYHELRLDKDNWLDVGNETNYTLHGLFEGNHTVEVRAVNEGKMVKDRVDFRVETDPYLKISSPEEGEVLRESNVTIEWTEANTEYQEVRLDSSEWVNVSGRTDYKFEGVDDGGHEVELRSTLEGNEVVTSSTSFSIDTSAHIQIASPTEGEIVKKSSLTIEWRSHHSENDEISLDGGDWIEIGNNDSYTFKDIDGGHHSIRVKAVGENENSIDRVNMTLYLPKGPIRLDGDDDLDDAAEQHGWAGTGSEEDPYIIEWYDIDGGEQDSAIYMGNVTDHFIIRNCRLHDADRDSGVEMSNSGLYLYNTKNGMIKDNSLSSNSYGLRAHHSYGNRYVNNTLTNNHIGLFLSSSNSSIIENNTISKSHYPVYGKGISLKGCRNDEISNNYLFNNNEAISVSSSSENTLLENDASYNGEGISIKNSDENKIRGSKVSINTFGIYLYRSEDNNISGTEAFENSYGIYLSYSKRNRFYENNISNSNWYGIRLFSSHHNDLSKNTVSASDSSGIYLYSSKNNTLHENELIDDGLNIWGRSAKYWDSHSIDPSNTVNGKPIYYWKNEEGGTVPEGAGQIILANCTDVVIKEQNITVGEIGILLGFSEENRIVENTVSQQVYSVTLRYSHRNILKGNSLINNTISFYLYRSRENAITENFLSENDWPGVFLSSSNNNLVSGNNISDNHVYGIYITRSQENTIYHNEFNNEGILDSDLEAQAYDNKDNEWNKDGEGNHWSDYKDRYPESSEVEDENIWNRSYEISGGGNKDEYPLKNRDAVDDLSVHILNPKNQSVMFSPEVTIEWASKGGEGEMDYSIRVNGDDWTDLGDSTSYTLEGLEDGGHTVEISAEDGAGNEISDRVDFDVNLGVYVEMNSPEDGSVKRKHYVSIDWEAKNHAYSEVRLDGPGSEEGDWDDVGDKTEHRFEDLEDGEYEVKVRTVDEKGNTATDSVNFSVKTVDIELISPDDGEVISRNHLTVKWTSENAEYHEIRVCEGRWENVGNSRGYELSSLENGEYTVEVRAWDESGRYKTDSVSFTINSTSPPLKITSPKEGSIFNTDEVLVEWEAEPIEEGIGIDRSEIKTDDGTWTQLGTSTEYTIKDLEDGGHTVVVRVTDESGNLARSNVTFVVDTTPPEITINSPESGDELDSKFITVEWEGKDETSGIEYYQIRVNGGDWELVGPNENYTFAGLATGEHTVEVRGWDRAGNNEIEKVTFEIERFDIPYYIMFIGAVAAVILIRVGIAILKEEEKGAPKRTLNELETELDEVDYDEYEEEYKL
ncbi:MAG: right-handed parallel beta-helix repeat-containing protein [Candidatus Thermoplasmatota archaeon]|nr:right-handed parallel beta-helix repeat-containing protein [Candidatus Thermoplasmatota archaeon]